MQLVPSANRLSTSGACALGWLPVLRKTVVFLTGFLSVAAGAQEFPSRPVRILTVETGSGQDITARLIAPELTERLRRPVIVENRARIAINTVAKSAPDGHTVLLYGPSLWVSPFFEDTQDYDPVRDFAAVTLAVTSPNILVINPSLPVRSVSELIAYAKDHPGQLNYGSGGTGSNSHLAAELLKSMAGINIVRIPYKGAGLALNDVIAGRVQMIIPSGTSAVPHIKSGKVRALAITSARPSEVFPDMPTVASTVPGYESSAITGMFVPAGTPAYAINKLNEETVRSLRIPEIKLKLLGLGMDVVGSSPRELEVAMKEEMALTGRLIKEMGMK